MTGEGRDVGRGVLTPVERPWPTSNDAANHLDYGIPRDGRGDSAGHAAAGRLGGTVKNKQPRGFARSKKAAEAGYKSGKVRRSKPAKSAVGVDVPDVASHETA